MRQNLVEFERQIKSGEFILPAADNVQGVVRCDLPQAKLLRHLQLVCQSLIFSMQNRLKSGQELILLLPLQ